MELLLSFPLLNIIYLKYGWRVGIKYMVFSFSKLFEKIYQNTNEPQPSLVFLSSPQIPNKVIMLIFYSPVFQAWNCHVTQK